MTLAEDIMMAGLGMVVVAFALFVWVALKTAKRRAEHYRQLPEEYPGLTGDVCALLVWSGWLMVQISNILLHAEPGGSFRVTPLTWAGTAAALFIFGVYAGRLTMRLEIRRYKAKREEQAREARA